MTPSLDPLRAVLNDSDSRVEFFFRDDDVGWADDHLWPLLDIFREHGAPIDLAVIPLAITVASAKRLQTLRHNSPIGIHQHGLSHQNHERAGRKCEFGTSRSRGQQLRDIAEGQRIMHAMFDDSADSIFTPPWNRCTRATADCLRVLGFRTLSRDLGAGRLELEGLAELPVHIDWSKRGRADRLAAAVESGGPIGIMFHHAEMTGSDYATVGELLDLLRVADAPISSMGAITEFHSTGAG
jgi:Polysaccharide deacetylase